MAAIEEGERLKLALFDIDEESPVETLDDPDGKVEAAPVDC